MAQVASAQTAAPCRAVRTMSDLHTDHSANQSMISALQKSSKHKEEALIVAGDITHKTQLLEWTFRCLTQAFNVVTVVWGNHDLWLERGGPPSQQHSLHKLQRLERICRDLGVYTSPIYIPPLSHNNTQRPDTQPLNDAPDDSTSASSLCGSATSASPAGYDAATSSSLDSVGSIRNNPRGCFVIPLLSWHHESFDTEPPLESIKVPPVRRVMADYKLCKWPKGLDQDSQELAKWIDQLNDERFDEDALKEACKGIPTITFSHFLPRQELMPEKRFLAYPELPKAAGSVYLNERLKRIRPDIHIFGHIHFGWDMTLEGIRYLQYPLSYPAEREARLRTIEVGDNPSSPQVVYDCSSGHFVEQQSTVWSDYYSSNARDPHGIYPLPEFLTEKWPAADGAAANAL